MGFPPRPRPRSQKTLGRGVGQTVDVGQAAGQPFDEIDLKTAGPSRPDAELHAATGAAGAGPAAG